ncbi:MAG: THUMP domain-containing class I SAM-dependent RNA methyltransferase [Phycisphaerales bacterium]
MKPPDPTKKSTTRIACARHITPWLRKELEALNHDIQHEDPLGLHIGASIIDALDLTLRLRTASHILYQLTSFRCPSIKALTKHIAAYPWEHLIPLDGYFTIRSSVTHPAIDNDLYANRLVKDAIADRFTTRFDQRPDSGPDRTGVILHFYWHEDRATLYLNINGPPLSDRGYRKLPHTAPMRESLAAAVLIAAGYDGTTPLINPMCGSGTLAIEAALIATNRAPGLLRPACSALFTTLNLEPAWQAARAAARKPAPRPTGSPPIPPIIATDHDPAAIDAARRNATTAGVDHLIQFQACDFANTPLPETPAGAHIILNPEYGQRLGATPELAQTYARIAEFLKHRCPGAHAHIFTASKELAKHITLRPTRRTPFLNANLECRLLSYDIFEPRPLADPDTGSPAKI